MEQKFSCLGPSVKGANILGLEQPELDEKESSKGLGLGMMTGQEMMTES